MCVKYTIVLALLGLLALTGSVRADEIYDTLPTVEADLGASREGSRTDDELLKREEEAIKIDGLNVAQVKELRDKAEKFSFQAEVNIMMWRIIYDSQYINKDIFLRELISNASDALDKIRLLSVRDKTVLSATEELSIRIKADKDNHILHIIDTGIGMTKADLVNNLGTIPKSGIAKFLSELDEVNDPEDLIGHLVSDLIGQFGVGFYSAFLVADRVVVTTKNNDDKQYIWESDSNRYSIVEDPRGPTLKRGTQISLHLKEEAWDFLEIDTIRNLVQKYSQFINFNIYLWNCKTEQVEEPIDEDEEVPAEEKKEKDEEGAVHLPLFFEEEKEPKTRKIEKRTWDWELLNDAKPIWTRKPSEVDEKEYEDFYKSLTKDTSPPLSKIHFVAEGEVTFKSILYIPKVQPSESFNKCGTRTDNIKLIGRRVFITDDFQDIMPNYLNFIRGIVYIVDSDDLPLNVSRETLQQHKLIKVIRKKLIRKALDMMKKMDKEDYKKFWAEYSTNLKLGVIEDSSNRNRLAKLLMFRSSSSKGEFVSLAEYVERMKKKQQDIYYIAGGSLNEVETTPFVERFIKKGYEEVLYLTEAVDEYCIELCDKVLKDHLNRTIETQDVEMMEEMEEMDFEEMWIEDRWSVEGDWSEDDSALENEYAISDHGWNLSAYYDVTTKRFPKSDDEEEVPYSYDDELRFIMSQLGLSESDNEEKVQCYKRSYYATDLELSIQMDVLLNITMNSKC